MRVNHRGADVSVAQEFLDGPNVIPVFQEVGGKAVPKSVGACRLGYSSLQHGLSYRLLQDRFMKMVPLSQAGLAIDVEA